jgi:hypothetical protein
VKFSPRGQRWFDCMSTGLLTGLLLLASQFAVNRLGTTEYPLDPDVPGLVLRIDRYDRAKIVYQDDHAITPDGLGLAVVKESDYAAFTERFDEVGYKPNAADFPVVAFFNASGFDSSGEAVVVRRASDGGLLYASPDKAVGRVRLVVPQRDGALAVHSKNDVRTVQPDDFYSLYVNVRPPAPLPPAEELAKMTDEQLAKLGVSRVRPQDTFGKSGVRGRVYLVGGAAGPRPLPVPIHLFRGKVEPYDKFDDKDDRRVVSGVVTNDGSFEFVVEPGTYTVVVEVDGKMRGNAANPKSWPTVTVKEGAWTDYDIRITR